MTTEILEATCRCGAHRYASQAEAEKVERSGADKCPNCRTFATDHVFSGDERCTWDDIRYGSHR